MGNVNWEEIRSKVGGAKSLKEIEQVLKANGVSNPVEWLTAASSTYAYNRAYRAKRNQSMTALKAKIAELEAKVS